MNEHTVLKRHSDDANWTIREICQQPDAWQDVLASIDQQSPELENWLAPILARQNLHIIFTGAGSSAYIGEALAPVILQHLGRPAEAISTTSLVGAPEAHLLRDRPTLLVSFGRSGNSPESVGAVDLADQMVEECYHLILCCNPDSKLVLESAGKANRRTFLMPPQTADKSFAMTSSFSSMLLSALILFLGDKCDQAQLAEAIQAAREVLDDPGHVLTDLVSRGFDRLVFLGTGPLQGIATEAALKTLELSAGGTVALSESALGFRHGPKFIVDHRTAVIILSNPDEHSGKYDDDIADELDQDAIAESVVRLNTLPALVNRHLPPHWQALVYLVWCQLLAYQNALRHGVHPDNPSPSGQVNRVVQGVTIHPYPGN
jgi:tagatose-6-phosphate ketose/aldose isomerase